MTAVPRGHRSGHRQVLADHLPAKTALPDRITAIAQIAPIAQIAQLFP